MVQSVLAQNPSTLSKAVNKLPERFEHLDGLRGLAALFVVLHHAYIDVDSPQLPSALIYSSQWLHYGHFSVAIFIVLSGYCLMLSVARTPDYSLPKGLFHYFKRRAKRILPPYYGALLLCLLLIAAVDGLGHFDHTIWDNSLPAFSLEALLPHLLLIHNFSANWVKKIDYPMWSVALEWQFYFLFSLVLLPLWRRFGPLFVMFFAFVVGYIPLYFLHGYLEWSCPWFLGLFALGMVAAAISVQPGFAAWRKNIPWAGISLLLALAVGAMGALFSFWWVLDRLPLIDPLVGLAAACLLVACSSPSAERMAVLKVLRARWLVACGMFSYSLYLVHAPILAIVRLGLKPLALTPVQWFWMLPSLGTICATAVAWLFYRIFERPFLNLSR
ncbi:acyltransferase family protein [Gloeobacter kilaueensis]|uniref:Acyltransferase 3 n=1 Tax=Gloeobacter kilaueensis (strain ATCC BAA-2537 / CCAP 1431/1 / ULC 316 / JS1) TaxID=1183438 RepID=U5QPX7_GLOK1|nr:acyltransferase [Gloeobacter kilaueensis]AGY59684.1 acyltransferase 3 [Gloeobacter kilaueensis JS1]